ncbi:MAG: hypothetical protein LKM30_08000 [Bacilli bacterium]|jgi:hypothetical protein|nr:hypothetical protein [Bacilli bacterium]
MVSKDITGDLQRFQKTFTGAIPQASFDVKTLQDLSALSAGEAKNPSAEAYVRAYQDYLRYFAHVFTSISFDILEDALRQDSDALLLACVNGFLGFSANRNRVDQLIQSFRFFLTLTQKSFASLDFLTFSS